MTYQNIWLQSQSRFLPGESPVPNNLEARRLEPAMGFEPATACLQNRCSTVELRRRTWVAPAIELGKNKNFETAARALNLCGATSGGSPGTRTPNLLIKSQLLYH